MTQRGCISKMKGWMLKLNTGEAVLQRPSRHGSDGKRMPSRRANQAERPDKTIGAAVNTGIETSENKALPWAHYRPVTLPMCKHT